jgi:hypothetical protein
MFNYKLSQFSGDYQAWFASIANQVLQSALYINDDEYEIYDLSIHFYSSNFNYPHCVKSSHQKEMGKWFYQDQDAKILDITFNDSDDVDSCGGILLRGIKNKNVIYDGPAKIHDLIRKKLGQNFLKEISGKNIKDGELRVEIKSGSSFIPHYSLLRENLRPVDLPPII